MPTRARDRKLRRNATDTEVESWLKITNCQWPPNGSFSLSLSLSFVSFFFLIVTTMLHFNCLRSLKGVDFSDFPEEGDTSDEDEQQQGVLQRLWSSLQSWMSRGRIVSGFLRAVKAGKTNTVLNYLAHHPHLLAHHTFVRDGDTASMGTGSFTTQVQQAEDTADNRSNRASH